jgi:putative hemin transport protein
MQTTQTAAREPGALYEQFTGLRRERKLRHRDAALMLGVSEGHAIAAAVGMRGALRASRLRGPWPGMFEDVRSLGNVLALTRNETTVHEKTGCYEEMSHQGLVGLALGKAIDLRIYYHRWKRAYAVTEDTDRGEQRSLQIFDAQGNAVHKVFLRGDSDLAAWFGFAERHAHEDQSPGDDFSADPGEGSPTPDAEVDVAAFHAAWAAMKDTHEFFPLLRRFNLARTQALRLAPADFAYRVGNDGGRAMLRQAAAQDLSIMCFVGNPGMIQIHTGPVKRVEVIGGWLNVLDPGFSLHMREDRVAATWVVKKPTSDGVVTSLELFDGNGEAMAMFFGERKPGKPELDAWRTLVAGLPRAAS